MAAIHGAWPHLVYGCLLRSIRVFLEIWVHQVLGSGLWVCRVRVLGFTGSRVEQVCGLGLYGLGFYGVLKMYL